MSSAATGYANDGEQVRVKEPGTTAADPKVKRAPIVYRDFAEKDFDDVAAICARTWMDDVEGVYDRITFGRVVTAGSLKRSQFALVAQQGMHVVGACFGGFAEDGAIVVDPAWERRFNELMVPARQRAKIGGPNVEERLFGRIRMYTTADVFISRGFGNAEAELNLCVVDPSARGQGIGTHLLDEAVERFRAHGAHGFFTMMTKESDREFSERHGLELIQEKRGFYGDSGKSPIYLYGRRL